MSFEAGGDITFGGNYTEGDGSEITIESTDSNEGKETMSIFSFFYHFNYIILNYRCEKF